VLCHRLLACFLVAALAAPGCAVNPVTGQPEFSMMSPEREARLGEEAAKEVADTIGLVNDPALTAYVEALGQRLARHSPRQDVTYRFAVADMPEPNAFALPGGWIYVSRGLLVLANSEAELANVIGHEIGHVAARHAASREARSVGAGVLSLLGAVVASAALGTEVGRGVGQIFQLAGAGLIASYSRGQERQADDIGQRIAAEAGWDPGAMPAFLHTLERDTELHHPEAGRPSFLDSHPVTRERVENTTRLAAALPVAAAAPVARDRGAFLAKLDGLLVGPDPAEGVFREARFLHPGLRLVVDFPRGWTTANGKTVVGAAAPEKDALLLLQAQERGDDPRAAAARFAEANRIELLDPVGLRIGGLPALRARAVVQSSDGPVVLDLTWVAHATAVFRFTGMSPAPRFAQRAAALESAAKSFRRLSDSELASIRDVRLRIVAAARGERMTDVSRRSSNVWSIDELAVANGLPLGASLGAGQPLKVAVEVPYAR